MQIVGEIGDIVTVRITRAGPNTLFADRIDGSLQGRIIANTEGLEEP